MCFVVRAEASLNAVQGRVSSERYAAMVAHTSNPSAHAAVLFEEAILACDLTSYVHPPPSCNQYTLPLPKEWVFS